MEQHRAEARFQLPDVGQLCDQRGPNPIRSCVDVHKNGVVWQTPTCMSTTTAPVKKRRSLGKPIERYTRMSDTILSIFMDILLLSPQHN